MTKYEKEYCNGMTDKVLGRYAQLPLAVDDAQGFQGYCDGYMGRDRSRNIVAALKKNIFTTLVFS